MPFITQEHRITPDLAIAGDNCFLVYKLLMDRWRESPRWTTVDAMMQELIEFMAGGATTQYKSSALLAYMVFFCREVMPYEEKQCLKNGEV